MKLGLLFFSFAFLASPIFASKWTTFTEIKEALDQGNKIRLQVDLNQCSPKFNLSGIFTPEAVLWSDAKISFSLHHPTRANPAYSNQTVVEHVSYQILPSNIVKMDAVVLDPQTLVAKNTTHQFQCHLGLGAFVFTK